MPQLLDLLPIWELLPENTVVKTHQYTPAELGADHVGYSEEHGQSGFPEAQW